MNAPLADEQKLQRYDDKFDKASGSRFMVEDEDGGWVKFEDVENRLYEIQLKLGAVFHALSNEDDASLGAELLEPILTEIAVLQK